jgi:hypothetical protein
VRLAGAVLTIALSGVLAGSALAGCTSSDLPAPRPAPQQRPASLAGGACLLIKFETLERILGQHYTIAASAKKDSTNTCVVRTEPAPVPEVAVSVTPSKADVAVFIDVVKPKGATVVPGVGRVAYQVITPAKAAAGPVLEIGWLTGDARLMFLRWTLPSGADAGAEAPKLVALAKELDKSSI